MKLKTKIILFIIQLIIMLGALLMCCAYYNWQLFAIIVLAIWVNNIQLIIREADEKAKKEK